MSISRIILLVLAVWFALGAIVTSFTEDDLDTADYPTCVELMDNPGTAASAMCSFDGNVIEARDYPGWDY